MTTARPAPDPLLLLTNYYPFGTGESFFGGELAAIARRSTGIVVPVAVRPGPPRTLSPGLELHVPVRPRLFRPPAAAVMAVLRTPARRTIRSMVEARILGDLVDLVRSRRVRHIHALWAGVPASIATELSRRTGVPWSFSAHRGDIVYGWDLDAKVLGAEFVHVIAESSRALLRERLGPSARARLEKRSFIAPVAVEVPPLDVERAGDGHRIERGILVAANLIEVKGHRVVLEALARSRRDAQPWKACFAGEGPLRDVLSTAAAELGVADLVEWSGQLPHEVLIERMRSPHTGALVVASLDLGGGHHEGVPVVILEAMAHGLNVVATRTGGIPEVADGRALLVPPGSPRDLLDALERLVADPQEAARLRRAAHAHVRVLADGALSRRLACDAPSSEAPSTEPLP